MFVCIASVLTRDDRELARAGSAAERQGRMRGTGTSLLFWGPIGGLSKPIVEGNALSPARLPPPAKGQGIGWQLIGPLKERDSGGPPPRLTFTLSLSPPPVKSLTEV